MSEANRQAIGVLLLGLVLGTLADVLFWGVPPGINLLVWMAATIVGVGLLMRLTHLQMGGWGRWAAIPLIVGSAAVAWRQSSTLLSLTVVALLVSWGWAILFGQAGNPWRLGIDRYVAGYAMTVVHTIGGAFALLFRDIHWEEVPRGRSAEGVVAVGRGLLIAAPLLVIFGLLLMSADAVFGNLLSSLFHFDVAASLQHLFTIVLWTAIVGGSLRAFFRSQSLVPLQADPFPGLTLGMVELCVVLGALNALFLAFVLVQFRYFFGGAETVVASAGLTYADYARRGFFELVTVAALVLPILLMGNWLLRQAEPAHQRRFRYLAGVMVALLIVIMVSAWQRMRLYQSEYGLTELRLYTTALMIWLAAVFLWFAVTVLRGHAERFAAGALAGAFAVLVALYILNPDAYIARTNLDRLAAGRQFDPAYLVELGGDAVPIIVARIDELPFRDRQLVAKKLLAQWGQKRQPDWRGWNLGRESAHRAVTSDADHLRAVAEQ